MKTNLVETSAEFIRFIETWLENLPELALDKAVLVPEKSAILSVDVINGFCVSGPLASDRVGKIVAPIADLFTRAWAGGIRHIILSQDTHEPDAVEFGSWPPHCIRGTAEAETVDAFKSLPFFDQMVVIEKNSIATGINTGLTNWITTHPEIDTFIVVGDCTDLCTYQLGMHLRLDANARQIKRRVIVPVDCVETYDRSVEVARQQGGLPHHADLLHAVFLYHMALNGIEVVQSVR